MWNSINSVVKPKTLTEAYSLVDGKHVVLFGGGSYLVSEKDETIHTLVDINSLVNNTIKADVEGVIIGGGATLQAFINTVTTVNPDCRLIDGCRYACPSKNIRNQRTFGGELGKGRCDSDILVFLNAVNADITVVAESKKTESIRNWDGRGIVTQIEYIPNNIEGVELMRSARIPSAPSVVSVCAIKKKDYFDISIGGKCSEIQTFSVPAEKWNNTEIKTISSKVVRCFSDDQYGSLDYKHILIETLINRSGSTL